MSNDDAVTNFDQALSPRLGQRSPSESTSVLMFDGANLPEVSWPGQIIYRYDTQMLQVYTGVGWEDVVGGTFGILTFVGPEPPVAQTEGDLWFDTDDQRKLYRAASQGADVIAAGEWELFRDAGVDAALAAALSTAEDLDNAIVALESQIDNATAIADGKIDVFYSDTQPTVASEGDLWFNTTSGQAHRLAGAAWVLIQDVAITQALNDAQDAQTTADGKISAYYQDAAPGSGNLGDLWYDTGDLNHPYYWDGDSWTDIQDGAIGLAAAQIDEALDLANDALTAAEEAQTIADGKIDTFYQSTMPSGSIGDLWFDTDDNRAYRHNGTTFVSVQDAGIQQALADAADAVAAADGKVEAYYTGTSPTTASVGDLWYDTSDGNKAYYFNGSSWSPIPVFNDNVQPGVMDNELIVGATIVAGENANSGERMVLRSDGGAGIMRFYTGVAGETNSGYINPHLPGGGYGPGLTFVTGTTSSHPTNAYIEMVSTNTFNGFMVFGGSARMDGDLTMNAGHDINMSGGGDLQNSGGDVNAFTVRGTHVARIGTDTVTTVPTTRMNASGFIQRTTHANSSRRYKKNELPAEVNVEAVLQLEPKTYQLKREAFAEDAEVPEGRQYGFIAEDAVELGLDWLVEFDDQGRPDLYDYAKHSIVLQATNRHQAQEIKDLRDRVARLESLVENLTKES